MQYNALLCKIYLAKLTKAISFRQYHGKKNCKNSFPTLIPENIKIAGDFFWQECKQANK